MGSPEGWAKRRREAGDQQVIQALKLASPGGVVQVRWEREESATPLGQMPFFIEFLNLTGVWDRWFEESPLVYESPNAPGKRDVLGRGLLSILSGHRRYAHVMAIWGDGVNPGLFHAGQRTLTLTSIHGRADRACSWTVRTSTLLKQWGEAEEPLPGQTVWHLVCQLLITLPTGLPASGIAPPSPQPAVGVVG